MVLRYYGKKYHSYSENYVVTTDKQFNFDKTDISGKDINTIFKKAISPPSRGVEGKINSPTQQQKK